MKCFIVSVLCLVAASSFTQGMTIHLLDIAAQQSSIEDGSLLTRIFFSKNITGRIAYTTELDGTVEELQPTQKNMLKRDKDSSDEDDPDDDDNEIDEVFDSWSIVWYIASFSGLILFFLIVSCSEWCCRKRIRRQQQQQHQQANATTSTTSQTDMRVIATRSQPEQQAPPSYDQFAPPSYDSLIGNTGETKKSQYEVYVVPVHTMTTIVSVEGESVSSAPPLTPSSMVEEAPPSYAVLNMEPSVTHVQDHSARAPTC